ncbi:hypothetical protein [Nostoc parmelioides]|uniref:Uncharacterized protein n=1 Tax=Nostoc parmelioides FACHB-3921 TaxID=2692909 RepID=A0ABR8BPV0_9NOSO|nr:hypothetical protein [Nostoc parmelioides]MBD2255649.1 hypothetical protein [Nostoc parmelioides FACHB-3921]
MGGAVGATAGGAIALPLFPYHPPTLPLGALLWLLGFGSWGVLRIVAVEEF